MKINILFITSFPGNNGGISNWVRIIQNKLSFEEEIKSYFIYPSHSSKKEVDTVKKKFFRRIIGNYFLMISAKKEIKALIKNVDIDIIHITTSCGLALFRDHTFIKFAKRKNIPIVYHIRIGRIPEIEKRKTIEWYFLKRNIILSDCVISIDKNTFKCLESIYGDKILYIPNCFDENEIFEFNDTIMESSSNFILFSGWIIKSKGVTELLNAWTKIVSLMPNLKLQLIGPIKDDYYQELIKTFNLVNVSFEGKVSHKEALSRMNACKIFVLPSYTEGFPNVVLEAMAFGKPIVATNVGAIPEMIDTCGTIIDTQNANQLYNGILDYLTNEKKAISDGNRAKTRAFSNYASSHIFNIYKSVWMDLYQSKLNKENR